jgi:hypothetical protein
LRADPERERAGGVKSLQNPVKKVMGQPVQRLEVVIRPRALTSEAVVIAGGSVVASDDGRGVKEEFFRLCRVVASFTEYPHSYRGELRLPMLKEMALIAAECLKNPRRRSIWVPGREKYVCPDSEEGRKALALETKDSASEEKHPPIDPQFKLVFLTAASGTLLFIHPLCLKR